MKKILICSSTKAATLLVKAAVFAAISITTLSVQATSPTEFDVTGNTITFNFSDWYQVQNASDYTSVCEGRDPCTVPNGEYIVINHSTSERFMATVGDVSPIDDTPTHVLSWLDDGWYQVQDAETFQVICEGGLKCIVVPGKYVIINHTTGVRTEVVVLSTYVTPSLPGTPSTPAVTNLYPPYSDFIIEGKSITFTQPGWFQVQKQYNFETVCEGQERCDLASSGYHQVINFTSGQQWQNVFIGEDRTVAQCDRDGGRVIGDIGDGAIHRPEYRCESGLPPKFTIFTPIGEPGSIEGSVCCV